MVCEDCKEGSRLLQEEAVTKEFADDMHAQCAGGNWCDCQHKTHAIALIGPAITS